MFKAVRISLNKVREIRSREFKLRENKKDDGFSI